MPVAKNRSITTMSDDVLLNIFRHLDLDSLMSASCVCWEWNRIAQDTSLWANLDLSPYSVQLQPETLHRILSKNFAPLGRRLVLGGCDVSTDALANLLETCLHLESLSLKASTVQSNNTKCEQKYNLRSLKMLDLRHARGQTEEIENILRNAVNLECIGVHSNFLSTMTPSFFLNKPLLRVLDCSRCDSMNDEYLEVIANNCPELEYVALSRCYNFLGSSLPLVLRKCRNLKTLLLNGTRVTTNALMNHFWANSRLSALDLRYCSRAGEFAVAVVILSLPRLRYLRCPLTDDNCKLFQYRGFAEVEVLQILRRYPITIDIVSSLLIGCTKVTHLDVSAIPFAHDHFEAFLSRMPKLRSLCFAANECSGTDRIVQKVALYSTNLESLWIIYYHSNERDDIMQAFRVLMDRCKSLRTVNITGLYVNDLIDELVHLKRDMFVRRDLRFLQNEDFVLPLPEPNVDSLTKI